MKKILNIIAILFVLSLLSCKEVKKNTAKYSIDEEATTIEWVAYKKTEKVPVKGVFNTSRITNKKIALSAIEAIDGLDFTIPVNSIDSKNQERDAKLITSFFGSMSDTENIKGVIHIKEKGIGSVDLTMNGITFELPITYTRQEFIIDINAVLNLDNWKAKVAIDALNLVCEDLHKGEDGVSKTWNEVSLHIVIKTKKSKQKL